MKITKGGIFRVRGTVYPYDILVCLGVTREDILTYFKKTFLNALTDADKEQIKMTGLGRTVRLENNAFICWTKDFPRTSEQYSALAHEIFHTIDLMLRRAGLSLSDDSDEAWAYAIGWLTKEIYSAFKL